MKRIYSSLNRLNNRIKSKKTLSYSQKDGNSFRISLVAIILSLLSVMILGANLYFQFFFKSYHMQVALNNISLDGDSIIKSRLLFSNIGNQYITVSNCRFFYSKDDSLHNFRPNMPINDNHKAIILRPTEQTFFEIQHSLILDDLFWHQLGLENSDFIRKSDYVYINIFNDTIVDHKLFLFLEIEFYNREGILSQHYERVGSITFERNFNKLEARIKNLGYNTLTFSLEDMYSQKNYVLGVIN